MTAQNLVTWAVPFLPTWTPPSDTAEELTASAATLAAIAASPDEVFRGHAALAAAIVAEQVEACK